LRDDVSVKIRNTIIYIMKTVHMFLVILTYTRPIEEIDLLRPAHLEFLDKYYAKDFFLMSGRQTSLTGGIILAKAANLDEINVVLTEDPYYIKKVATYQVIEFTPSKVNTRIGNLIN